MKQRRHSPTTIAVLVAMLDQPEAESYGYSLTARTGLVSGSLYPILSRLEKRGLVIGNWEQLKVGRPPRRVYKLTDAGREEAEKVKAEST